MGNKIVVGTLNVILRFLTFHCIRDTYITINKLTFDYYKHDQTKKIILYYIVLYSFIT